MRTNGVVRPATATRGGRVPVVQPDDDVRRHRRERRAEWPLMGSALLFLAAYAAPIIEPDLPSSPCRCCDRCGCCAC